MLPPSHHIHLLAECVVKLPPRDNIGFIGSRLPNDAGLYEMIFRDDSTDAVETVTVPVEEVAFALASSNTTKLLANITSQYMMLFRRGTQLPQDSVSSKSTSADD